ncbi:MAG: transposase [Eubacteriales bacterium]
MEKRPNRKRNRLVNHDYSSLGSYFLTVCIKDRHEILAEIVGDAAHGVPSVVLSQTGIMVKQHVENINSVYKYIRLDNYMIMPDHVHLLISVYKDIPDEQSKTRESIPIVLNSLKTLTSKKFGETLWQRSYYDRIVRDEEDYQRIWYYIDNNVIE